ncbi:MAG: hypothetical protein JWM93_2445 [Frankiales bacterium]|nr:hypothetical protein [Frankiales bacterium]
MTKRDTASLREALTNLHDAATHEGLASLCQVDECKSLSAALRELEHLRSEVEV